MDRQCFDFRYWQLYSCVQLWDLTASVTLETIFAFPISVHRLRYDPPTHWTVCLGGGGGRVKREAEIRARRRACRR